MNAEQWHIPITEDSMTLQSALDTMVSFKLTQGDVPFSIQLFENPKYTNEFLFPGSVTLQNHDVIHILLGRGVLPMDEAFIIGFTMGSTKRLNTLRERIFLLITRYLYPRGYRFYNNEQRIFRKAANLARSMNCTDLSKVDFSQYLTYNLKQIRILMGIDVSELKKLYAFEMAKYKNPECQRLL